MPRKKAAPQLVATPKRAINRHCKPGRPPGEVPLHTHSAYGNAYAAGRWYQLQEAGIVPPSMAEPEDRDTNYTFQDAKKRTVKVKPYAKYMWILSWPEELETAAPKVREEAPLASFHPIEPGRKMRWFKDRSNWTPEKHVADLEERIAKCEAEDDDPSYWQKRLREYRASLR